MEDTVSIEFLLAVIPGIIAPCVGLYIKMRLEAANLRNAINSVRTDLEAQISMNEKASKGRWKSRGDEASHFASQQAEQWRFITEIKDRQNERDQKIVGMEKDIGTVIEKVDRAQSEIDAHDKECRETSGKLWDALEDLKLRQAGGDD